jgi:hypothetical protein
MIWTTIQIVLQSPGYLFMTLKTKLKESGGLGVNTLRKEKLLYLRKGNGLQSL